MRLDPSDRREHNLQLNSQSTNLHQYALFNFWVPAGEERRLWKFVTSLAPQTPPGTLPVHPETAGIKVSLMFINK